MQTHVLVTLNLASKRRILKVQPQEEEEEEENEGDFFGFDREEEEEEEEEKGGWAKRKMGKFHLFRPYKGLRLQMT